MRIALIGQAAFAEKALEALLSHGETIVRVFAPPDGPGGRADPLAARARALGLPLSQPESLRGEAEYELFKSLELDLTVMAFVTVIVPERILYTPRHKTICFHPSLLPRHRGASAINWAIIQGDDETGVSWFWPDRRIDTGPILLQRRVTIGANDSTGSLYFNTLFPLGLATMIEAIELVRAGNPPAAAQDERLATYEAPCRDEHAAVDFGRPARAVHNLVRGCDPQPGAFGRINGRQLRLYESEFAAERWSAPPGTIVEIDSGGMKVALDGATLTLKRARFEPNPKKVTPAELAAAGELSAGVRFD